MLYSFFGLPLFKLMIKVYSLGTFPAFSLYLMDDATSLPQKSEEIIFIKGEP